MYTLLALLSLAFTWAATDEPTVVLTDGSELQDEVVELSATGISLASGRLVDVNQIARVRFREPSTRRGKPDQIKVNLVDGSQILAAQATIYDGVVQIAAVSGWNLVLSSSDVTSIRLKQRSSSTWQSEWDQIASHAGNTQDLLVVMRGEHLDYLEGVVVEMTEQEIGFRMDGQVVTGKRERMDGIVFYRAPGRSMANEVCEIVTTEGSRLLVQEIQVSGTGFSTVLACGAALEIDRDAIVEFDFTSGRAVYLSDMTPATIHWTPLIPNPQLNAYLQELNRPRMDRSFSGQPVRLVVSKKPPFDRGTRTKEFEHGIAVKGGTRMVFILGERFSRLTGVVGFAPNASPDGRVELIILSDGAELLRREMANHAVDPVTLDLPLAKTRRLTVTVDYLDGRSVGDLIHFGDLKVLK